MSRTVCRWCGLMHGPLCPAVKAIEYFPDGQVRRVEFKADAPAVQIVPTLYPLAGTGGRPTGEFGRNLS